MISKSKLAIIAAVVATSVATPALAHQRHYGTATRHNGQNAFAMVPSTAVNSFSPAARGGGSVGYNENLKTDQW